MLLSCESISVVVKRNEPDTVWLIGWQVARKKVTSAEHYEIDSALVGRFLLSAVLSCFSSFAICRGSVCLLSCVAAVLRHIRTGGVIQCKYSLMVHIGPMCDWHLEPRFDRRGHHSQRHWCITSTGEGLHTARSAEWINLPIRYRSLHGQSMSLPTWQVINFLSDNLVNSFFPCRLLGIWTTFWLKVCNLPRSTILWDLFWKISVQ